MTDVTAFVRDHLAADAALARAAVSEPDDDAYLATLRHAASFYAPSTADPLGPTAGRWAVPGGTSPQATFDVGDSIGPAPLFAVAEVGEEMWIAYAGDMRDRAGTGLAQVLAIGLADGELKIVGRTARNPFAAGITWEPAGGVAVPLGSPVVEAELLAMPTNAVHARWLSERVGR